MIFSFFFWGDTVHFITFCSSFLGLILNKSRIHLISQHTKVVDYEWWTLFTHYFLHGPLNFFFFLTTHNRPLQQVVKLGVSVVLLVHISSSLMDWIIISANRTFPPLNMVQLQFPPLTTKLSNYPPKLLVISTSAIADRIYIKKFEFFFTFPLNVMEILTARSNMLLPIV